MTHKENTRTYEQIWNDIHAAIAANDNAKFVQLNTELINSVKQELSAEQKAMFDAHIQEADREILAMRGKRPMTSEETKYFTELGQAMASKDPKQALTNLEVAMPVTIVDKVMEDLRTNHPLLSKLNFIPSGAVTRWIYNTNGRQKAVWGELCDEIVKELTAGFKMVETGLYKLSAFFPVCKQALVFGPSYLEALVTGTLYEAVANGLEEAVVNGTGADMPIGMTRQVGEGVSVVDGVYPVKEKTAITDLSLVTVGGLIDEICQDENGKDRPIKDLILVCNAHDYYTKVLPATTILTPSGEYRSVLPYSIDIIPVAEGLERGEAVFGLAYRYACFAGSNPEGNIEYSDHVRFLQDQRVYIIKAFANGFPEDNNAFIFLNIEDLKPATYKVELVADEEDEG